MTLTKAQGLRFGELGAEPVDVVVVAAHADQVGAVDAGREQLLLLEVGGDEDVGLEPGGGGVGGDGVGEVAGRGAGDGLEAQLARLRDGDGDDPVLEGVGRVGGVVLDPQLGVEAETLGQPVGPDQRRQPRLERVAGPADEGQEVGVAPDPLRPGLDPPLRLGRVESRVVVGDLERAEAVLTGEVGAEVVARPALLALSSSRLTSDRPSVRLERKTSAFCGAEVRSDVPHIFQAFQCGLLDLAPPLEPMVRGGCRGFIGPVPPPL